MVIVPNRFPNVEPESGNITGVAVGDSVRRLSVEGSISRDVMDIAAPFRDPVVVLVRYLEFVMADSNHRTQLANMLFGEVHPW